MEASPRRTKRWWREQFVASHYAVLNSKVLLAELMKHKGYNTVTLARAVSNERIRRGAKVGVTSQMIGQLRNPDPRRVKSCSVDLAECIEAVLDVPAQLLFTVREKSNTTRETSKDCAA